MLSGSSKSYLCEHKCVSSVQIKRMNYGRPSKTYHRALQKGLVSKKPNMCMKWRSEIWNCGLQIQNIKRCFYAILELI